MRQEEYQNKLADLLRHDRYRDQAFRKVFHGLRSQLALIRGAGEFIMRSPDRSHVSEYARDIDDAVYLMAATMDNASLLTSSEEISVHVARLVHVFGVSLGTSEPARGGHLKTGQ